MSDIEKDVFGVEFCIDVFVDYLFLLTFRQSNMSCSYFIVWMNCMKLTHMDRFFFSVYFSSVIIVRNGSEEADNNKALLPAIIRLVDSL